jgi:Zn-dependent metalloprotease
MMDYRILSEAICDMFGQLVEVCLLGEFDWIMGKRSSDFSSIPSSVGGRSLKEP